ncbi:MAG: NAD-dependent protein deacylase [Candidatus Omnitrophica bacterium]|nr:NAD-dependent protein deacylase [Candidatus Omnitrophota bacterium]
MTEKEKLTQVAGLLKKARSAIFITGAGISADSGLPTYRGIGGIYNDNITEDGIPIETALAKEMLEKRPQVTWKYLMQIEQNCRKAKFNRAHEIISEAGKKIERVLVLTQNIDGFHTDCGTKDVIEIHGNIHNLRCTKCKFRKIVKDYTDLEIPPSCPQCKSIVRPDVVFFGEMLDIDKLEILEKELAQGFDIYFWIGTTAVFPYIQQPIYYAKDTNSPTVEINPSRTEISGLVDFKIGLGAREALSQIWDRYQII